MVITATELDSPTPPTCTISIEGATLTQSYIIEGLTAGSATWFADAYRNFVALTKAYVKPYWIPWRNPITGVWTELVNYMFPVAWRVTGTGKSNQGDFAYGEIDFATGQGNLARPERPNCYFTTGSAMVMLTTDKGGNALPTDEWANIPMPCRVFVVENIENEFQWFGNLDGHPSAGGDANRRQRVYYCLGKVNGDIWLGESSKRWKLFDVSVERLGNALSAGGAYEQVPGLVRVIYQFQNIVCKQGDDSQYVGQRWRDKSGVLHEVLEEANFEEVLGLTWPDGITLIT